MHSYQIQERKKLPLAKTELGRADDFTRGRSTWDNSSPDVCLQIEPTRNGSFVTENADNTSLGVSHLDDRQPRVGDATDEKRGRDFQESQGGLGEGSD